MKNNILIITILALMLITSFSGVMALSAISSPNNNTAYNTTGVRVTVAYTNASDASVSYNASVSASLAAIPNFDNTTQISIKCYANGTAFSNITSSASTINVNTTHFSISSYDITAATQATNYNFNCSISNMTHMVNSTSAKNITFDRTAGTIRQSLRSNIVSGVSDNILTLTNLADNLDPSPTCSSAITNLGTHIIVLRDTSCTSWTFGSHTTGRNLSAVGKYAVQTNVTDWAGNVNSYTVNYNKVDGEDNDIAVGIGTKVGEAKANNNFFMIVGLILLIIVIVVIASYFVFFNK